jgi:hypothetical protein
MNRFDREELQQQLSELTALIDDLRPHPSARLVSRQKFSLMAAVSGDADLIRFATRADEKTLFWDLGDEIVEQRIDLTELPAA